jgi:hypothetical protein
LIEVDYDLRDNIVKAAASFLDQGRREIL